MTKPVLFGWLLLALMSVLNMVAVNAAIRVGRRWFAAVLFVAVPMFVGFALAQMGVQLMGGGR